MSADRATPFLVSEKGGARTTLHKRITLMTKMKASAATRENIQDLDRDALLHLCGALIDSRNATQGIKKQLRKEDHLRGTMMPAAATMMEALAERAGLQGRPEVRSMIEALGNSTYLQWSEEYVEHEALPVDAEGAINPHAGDAEMALGAKVHEAITDLSGLTLSTNIPAPARKHIKTLIRAIEGGLEAAIKDGFKSVPGASWTASAETRPGDVVQIGSVEDIQHEIDEILCDLDMGMTFLRADLRAGMYRSIIRRLHILSSALRDQAQKDRGARLGKEAAGAVPF